MKFKTQKGITLIALIIIIVVLLVLAGISLNLVMGDGGILNRATNAVKTNKIAGVKEQVELKAADYSYEYLQKKYVNRDTSVANAGNYVGSKIAGEKIDGYTVSVFGSILALANGNEEPIIGTLNADGSIGWEENIDNSGSLVLALVDNLGTRSTIYLYGNPNKRVETSITTESIETSTGSTVENADALIDTPSYESNLTDAENYVTYTVNKNGTYTFRATANGETTEIKVIVTNIEKFTSIETLAEEQSLSYAGGKTNAYTYKGAVVPKGYFVDTNSVVDTGLVVTDAVDSEGYSTGNEWVWVPVNSTVGNNDYYGEESEATALYGAASVTYTKYSKLYSFMNKTRDSYGTFYPYGRETGTLGRPSSAQSEQSKQYREIGILTNNASYGDIENYALVNNRTTGTAFANVTDVATQFRDDFDKMVASVDNYNGFYIGRYEITENGEKPGITLTDTNWYTFYNQSLTMGKSYTESGMIYGCLWDATMQWLTTANYSVGYTGNTYSGYGNYKTEAVKVNNDDITITVKEQGTSKKLLTGQTSYTKSNNIYDLSGNCQDWTQEAYYTYIRVSRGGNCNSENDYDTNPAYRNFYSYTTQTHERISSRPHFCIK